VRAAVARWRAMAAAGAVARLSVHSPDRLARTSASHGVRVEACQRAGGEVIFLNREWGRSPEDDRRRPVPGMMAEDERAKLIARPRRGTRHAARAGAVRGLRGAPDGDRDVPTSAKRGQAHEAMRPHEACVVCPVLAGSGRERLPSGDVCRRRTRAGEWTRTGTTVWERRARGGRRKPPASGGSAACGKTPQEPRRPRLRAPRGRPLPPRRAGATRDVRRPAWRMMPGPAIVAPAVPELWRDNQRHARHARRGARSGLHGLGPCQPGGSADAGTRLSPRTRQGKPRTDASDRCVGTAASRVGGQRVGQQTPVRPDLGERAVWQAVCARLAPPRRRAEAYPRRGHPDRHTTRPPRTPLEAPLGPRRQGVARVIDRDADALRDQHACEPRSTRLRPRIAHVAAPRPQLAAEDALHTDLRLRRGRLEALAAQRQEGRAAADWRRPRAMRRALVTRVDVA
jgi:site-specific DNA recombinase